MKGDNLRASHKDVKVKTLALSILQLLMLLPIGFLMRSLVYAWVFGGTRGPELSSSILY